MIFLPGTDQQVKFLFSSTEIKDKKIIIAGPGTIEIAGKLNLGEPSKIIIIVDDYDSLITMRYRLQQHGEKNIEIRMMEYDNTDFRNDSVDVLFAQASLSVPKRHKIIKEIKRILKPGGTFCAGEIVLLKENPPAFINNIWESSELKPLSIGEFEKYYEERGFEILDKKDLSYTLREFYQLSEKKLSNEAGNLSEQEKSYYKKLLKKISHESNVYLKLGGNEYMGFSALIMRKK
jgi:ubiquinone/menaquinone biosynthesis C-methylase UbiE